jgi:hypothetical protein
MVRSNGQGGGDDAGFVAVDALVALAILSTTIALSIQSADVARRTADRAAETHRAKAVLQQLLKDADAAPGVAAGRSGALDWRRTVAPIPLGVGQTAATRLCRHSVEVRPGDAPRVYRASTVRLCPREGAR